ncbi:hypothetical protein ABW19_dt0209876 [Dactylella cylindrospora]|nr:hypothetical protein ABW19_dt0209876 [Dactylella cylindrospora]
MSSQRLFQKEEPKVREITNIPSKMVSASISKKDNNAIITLMDETLNPNLGGLISGPSRNVRLEDGLADVLKRGFGGDPRNLETIQISLPLNNEVFRVSDHLMKKGKVDIENFPNGVVLTIKEKPLESDKFEVKDYELALGMREVDTVAATLYQNKAMFNNKHIDRIFFLLKDDLPYILLRLGGAKQSGGA